MQQKVIRTVKLKDMDSKGGLALFFPTGRGVPTLPRSRMQLLLEHVFYIYMSTIYTIHGYVFEKIHFGFHETLKTAIS